MENKIDLKEIERRAFLSYHKDGILDIYLGIGIAMASSIFFYEYFIGLTGVVALLPILYAASKKKYTIPRLGYVKFSNSTQGKARRSITLALLLGTLSAVVLFFAFYSVISSGYNWIEPFIENWQIVIASILLVVFSLFGYVSELKRMYYYAVVSFLVFISGLIITVSGYWFPLILGGIICVNGLIHLYRFTQDYPMEKGHEDE